MIAIEAQDALLILQRKATSSSSTYWLERYERALDECSRNPDRTSPAAYQVRNALANAKKRIDNRTQRAPHFQIDDVVLAGVPDAAEATVVVEVLHWLHSAAGITAGQRALLQSLAEGEDAETLAARARIPVAGMRQRISRARAAARAAWARDNSQ
jgi:DNA-directed RNA polymerase specialized sigma24 family protein